MRYNECMNALKLTSIGNSVGAVLPKEVLTKLRAEKGTTLFLTESPEGFLLTRYDHEFETQMKLAKEVMDEYKDALHVLAK